MEMVLFYAYYFRECRLFAPGSGNQTKLATTSKFDLLQSVSFFTENMIFDI